MSGKPEPTLWTMKGARTSACLTNLAAILACLALLAATARGAGEPTFVLIGGALRDDNHAVFGELLSRHKAGTVVVVPFASAEPGPAAQRTAERFRAHRPDARIVTMPDPLEGEEALKSACAVLADADLVYFTGGDQSRITRRLGSRSAPGPVLEALRKIASERDVVIGGTSAGCAVMSDPMFTGGGSESALANLPANDGESEPGEPATRGVRLGPGLGLVENVILDSHFPERGRHGRMVAALERAGTRFGLGVAENRAVRLSGGTFTAIGDAAALLLDVADLAREGSSRRGVRISLLSDGDTFTPRPEPGRPHLFTPAKRVDRLPVPVPDTPLGKPWERGTILSLLSRLAADPSGSPRAVGEHFEVVLSADERTVFAFREGDPASLRVFDARLDIVERPPPP